MNSLFHLAAPEWALLKNPVRLKALSDCGIFATRPESDFDDIVSLTAHSCECSSAMIAFADSEHLHFKSTVGATKPLLQIIADSFFMPTVQSSLYVWADPSNDERSSADKIRFYAGVPLRADGDQIIGILCVTDPLPHRLSEYHEQALLALGRQTEHQLTLRRMISLQQTLIEEREKDIGIRLQSEAQLASALSRVSLINEIGKTARSGADPATILETAITKLGIALGADRCYFVTYSSSENAATIGPDWHRSNLKSIAGSYEMFSAPHNHDVRYLAGQTTVVEDAIKDNAHKESLISAGLGLRSLLRAPILQGTGMTALGVAMIEPRQWTEEEISLVESIAAQTRAAVEAARHIMRERALLRDVLASVTEGKLFLADTAADLPAPQVQFGSPVVLDKESGLAELRDLIRKASRQANHEEVRTFDTMTAASEAGMNAIVHADRGVATVSIGPNDSLQIRIEDKGMGIAFDDLPKATLSRGYSTKSTLGHGLKMMLETIDRFFLLTGATGTTVVLEQEKVEPPPSWLAKQHLK